MARKLLIAALMVTAACQRNDESPCQELSHYAPEGVSLGTDEQRCTQVLQFIGTIPSHYGMNFTEFYSSALSQRARWLFRGVSAVVESTEWQVRSFGPEPAVIPCGGLAMSPEAWSQNINLSKIIEERSDKLFVSLAIDISGNRASIRVIQDFDCDGTSATTEVIGRFQRGQPVLSGGWERISTTEAEIDE